MLNTPFLSKVVAALHNLRLEGRSPVLGTSPSINLDVPEMFFGIEI
jgi:hypothetical protein